METLEIMSPNNSEIIGYSAFQIFDECYEYNENACYIADSPESLKEFLEGAMLTVKDYRIDSVKISDILNDFGCSVGEFAMEPGAFKRFKKTADLTYSVKPYDDPFNKGEPDLFVVNLDMGKVVAQFDKEDRISDLLESFKILDGIYKRQQIDAAIELKEEITPYLVKILKKVLNNPAEYIENEDNYDHIYALFLLGHFREHRAHQIIADLFSLPDEIPDKVFGDTVTEDLAIILYRTCGGSLELIKSLALNKKAYQYCRSSALRAIEFAVVDGLVSREEIMSFLEPLLFDDDFNDGTDFLYFVARTICHLYPEGFMEKIKKAFDDEIIDPWMIGYESFEKEKPPLKFSGK